jgi:capsular exopolysaccharide synthesis family protein
MDLTWIWQIVRTKRLVIIQGMLVVGLAAFLGSWLITPAYETSCKILLMSAQRGVIDVGVVGKQLASIIRTSTDVDVNKVLADSKPYVDQMVYRLQLRDDEGNLIKARAGEAIGATIRDRLFPKRSINVTQYRDTDILQIKAASPDPEEARMMSNTLAEIMVDHNETEMRAEYKNARLFLEQQVEKVRKSYDLALLQLAEFQKNEKTIDLKIETQLAAKKMADLLKEKEDNIIDLAQARAKLVRVKQHLSKESPGFVSASTLKDSPQIEILKKRLTELKIQISQATAELTENHPRVRSLRQQISTAEAELKKEIDVYRSSAPELRDLERHIDSLEAHLEAVNGDVARYLQALGGIPDRAYKQASIDRELAAARQTYSRLLDFLYQIGTAEATTLSEIRIIEEATLPVAPISPNRARNTIIGVFVGLVFGLGLAFLMEHLDDTIKTVADVKEFRTIALVGAVPRFGQGEAPLILGKDPNDPVCESYRQIRNYLKMDERSATTVLVTSAGPGEGKSTTVANLGISVAREGRKVVIVDADLRRPGLHACFNLSNEVGLSDLLQGHSSTEAVIQATQVEGLSVIPSGPPFPDPGGLIESDQMGPLTSELRHRFDLVFLDSAPLLVKSDALVLGRYVDGSIIVLGSAKATRWAVHELLEILAAGHIKPLGFVLNGFPLEKGKGFYGYQYYGQYDRGLSTSEGSS